MILLFINKFKSKRFIYPFAVNGNTLNIHFIFSYHLLNLKLRFIGVTEYCETNDTIMIAYDINNVNLKERTMIFRKQIMERVLFNFVYKT